MNTKLKNLRDSLLNEGRKTFLAGLGLLAVAEEETRKVFNWAKTTTDKSVKASKETVDHWVDNTQKTIDDLVEKGKVLRTESQHTIEEGIEDAKTVASKIETELEESVDELTEPLQEEVDDLRTAITKLTDQVVDTVTGWVGAGLDRLGVPTQEYINTLNESVDALNARINELHKKA